VDLSWSQILIYEMERTPTPGHSDTPSQGPSGLVMRSRAIVQLPHRFSDLVDECPRNWEVRRIAQLTPARQDRTLEIPTRVPLGV
jgi:hypothetical protein